MSDYVKLLPDMIQRWIPSSMISLGTDGFGRSESREALRHFFEIDAEHICLAAIGELVKQGAIKPEDAGKAASVLGIDPAKPDPMDM